MILLQILLNNMSNKDAFQIKQMPLLIDISITNELCTIHLFKLVYLCKHWIIDRMERLLFLSKSMKRIA